MLVALFSLFASSMIKTITIFMKNKLILTVTTGVTLCTVTDLGVYWLLVRFRIPMLTVIPTP